MDIFSLHLSDDFEKYRYGFVFIKAHALTKLWLADFGAHLLQKLRDSERNDEKQNPPRVAFLTEVPATHCGRLVSRAV